MQRHSDIMHGLATAAPAPQRRPATSRCHLCEAMCSSIYHHAWPGLWRRRHHRGDVPIEVPIMRGNSRLRCSGLPGLVMAAPAQQRRRAPSRCSFFARRPCGGQPASPPTNSAMHQVLGGAGSTKLTTSKCLFCEAKSSGALPLCMARSLAVPASRTDHIEVPILRGHVQGRSSIMHGLVLMAPASSHLRAHSARLSAPALCHYA